MARRKKDSGLGGNETLFSGRKLQVPIPTTDLHVLEDHDDQRLVKAQVRWGSFGVFIPYNAIIDPEIDCLALVNEPIAFKAYKYRVVDIIPLPTWKNGVMIMPRLKVDGQERENVPMLIADLGAKCDMILGRQWLEEYYAPLADRLPVKKNSDEESPNQTNTPVSVSPPLEIHEDTFILKTSTPTVEKSVEPLDELNRLSDKRSEEDSRQPRVRLPKAKVSRLHINNPFVGVTEAPMITSKEDWIALDEDIVVRPTVRCPGYMDRDLSALREEIDELNEEDTYRSRIPIIDDQSFQPLVQLSRNDGVRRYRLDNGYIAGIPEAPVTVSRNRIIMEEDLVTALRVRFPDHAHTDNLSLFPCCDVSVEEEWSCFVTVDPAQEDSLTEATWNEAPGDCDSKSFESDALDTYVSNIDKDNLNSEAYDIVIAIPPGPHDTGWNSQFVQMKLFGWALRFSRLNLTEGQSLLFSRILSLRIIVNFTYRPASWFDTGWLFNCLFQLLRILFNLFFSSRLMLFESSHTCLRTGISARGG
jgi:hypothetical protein